MRRSGNHPCQGQCGKPVAANKRKCLKCLAVEVRKNLEASGREVDEEEITRLIGVFATSGY